jgi:hypothetical protein
MGLTFEKVWAMFRESDRRMRESREEADRRMEEADRKMRESREKTDRMIQEVARQMKETDRKMKETDEQLGRLGNRFGELAEHLVAPNIVKKFNALGFHFSDISTGLRKIILDESGVQKIAEFDILMENDDSIVGVEVKAKPSERDIENHARRLEILRRHRDKKNDKRKIHGALAGAIMPDSVKKTAIGEGMYVITQSGDTVKIDVPEGFVPKTW